MIRPCSPPGPTCAGVGHEAADRDPVTDPRAGDVMVTRGGDRVTILSRDSGSVTWHGERFGRPDTSETLSVREWAALANATAWKHGLGVVALAGVPVPSEDEP